MSATQEQISVLLDFLAEHKDLARNYVRSQEGRVRSKRLWEEITQQLNSLGGAVKTAPQWQKVWADQKYAIKKNRARRNLEARGTGGGPPSLPPETERERKIVDIMGEGFGGPSTKAVISPFVDENRTPNPRPGPIFRSPMAIEEVVEIQEEEVMDHDHLYCINPLPAEAAAAPPVLPATARRPTNILSARRLRKEKDSLESLESFSFRRRKTS